MRARLITVAVVLSIACDKPSGSATAPDDSSAEPAAPDPYAAYEFPPVADHWGLPEYAKVRDVLVEIEREQPELLVTLAGPKGDVLARVTSLDKLSADLARTPDMTAAIDLHEAVSTIHKLYVIRVNDRQPYGLEFLQLTAAELRAATRLSARLTEGLDEARLRAEPVGREGFLQTRDGMVNTYLGAIEAALHIPTIVDPSLAVAQLAPVAAEVASYLLPEERQSLGWILTALAAAGANEAQVAATRASIAASPMNPLVATFADEAKVYSAEKRQLQLYARAVEVGPEPGGIRYAFPDAGFSAVFHQRPNALLTNANTADGVTTTVRGLGISDATDYSTTIMCSSRPDDKGGFALEQLEALEATDIREVQIDGRRGFEGVLSKPRSHMIIRTVDVDRGGCAILAEIPLQLATSYEQQARAFLDSFTLGGFEG